MGALTLESILCTELSLPVEPPSVVIPYLGQLQEVRKSLYQCPDPSEFLLKFMSSLNTVMVPVRQYIELIETLFLFRDCMMAIPNAIIQLNPKPVFDCLKKLLKKLATLISFIPPISYIRSLVDLLNVLVQMLDEIVYMFHWVDTQITQYLALIQEALSTDDTLLTQAAACELSEIRMVSMNALDVMRLVGPLARIVFEPILSSIQNPILRAKLDECLSVEAQISGLADAFRDIQLAEIQPILSALTNAVQALNTMQNVLVEIYNVVGPILGKSTISKRSYPATVNF